MLGKPATVILLNGPLGIGKSTVGELLGEALSRSVSIDGDQLLALNPAPEDEFQTLHHLIALLFKHHLGQGRDRFIVNHFWPEASRIADLKHKLLAIAPETRVHCFRLTLPREENLRRIARRQAGRAINETDFEARTFYKEFGILSSAACEEVGVPFDASDSPPILVARIMSLLGLAASTNEAGPIDPANS